MLPIPCHPVEAANLVYVEVPKAGCTSIKWALAAFKGEQPVKSTDIHHWFGYTHARDVAELNEWLTGRWGNMRRFTVVRNPVDRFLSFYYGLQPAERGAWGDVNRYVIEQLGVDAWAEDIHVVPQTLLLGTNLSCYDHVGHTEDMAATAAWLGVAVPHHSRYEGVRQPLTAAALKRLRSVYRTDYEVLGYG